MRLSFGWIHTKAVADICESEGSLPVCVEGYYSSCLLGLLERLQIGGHLL